MLFGLKMAILTLYRYKTNSAINYTKCVPTYYIIPEVCSNLSYVLRLTLVSFLLKYLCISFPFYEEKNMIY